MAAALIESMSNPAGSNVANAGVVVGDGAVRQSVEPDVVYAFPVPQKPNSEHHAVHFPSTSGTPPSLAPPAKHVLHTTPSS